MKTIANFKKITITIREDTYKEHMATDIRKTLTSMGVRMSDIQIEEYDGEIEELVSLREYIDKHSVGAYHTFAFEIKGYEVEVCNTLQFTQTFNEKLLDEYMVEDAVTEDNGGDCESYSCRHHLKLIQGGPKP